MSDEADIVKVLREEEKLGKLQVISSEDLEYDDEEEEEESFSGGYKELKDKIDITNFEKQYKTIFENYSVAITLADEKERIILWNKYAEELLNMDEKDLFLRNVSTLYPPEKWQEIREKNIRQKGMKSKIETKMVRKNKNPVDVEISLCVLKGMKGKTVGSIAIIRDITKLKNYEKKIIETEEKYKTIFENSAVGIMLLDKNEDIISCNKYTETLLGYTEEDLKNKPVESLYPSEEWNKIRAENIREKGMTHHLETKIWTKDDKLIDIDISISVLKNDEGEIIGSIGIMRDVSKKKKMEEELNESEKKFKDIFDATSDFLIYLEKDIILDINNSALQTLGLEKKEIMGKKISFLKGKNFDEGINKHIDAIKNAEKGKEVKEYETEIYTKEGIKYQYLFSVDSIKLANEIKGIIIRGRDITKRQHAWNELVRLEEKYRVLAETSADGVITIDPLGRLTYINPSFEKMIEKRKSKLLATLFRDHLSENSIYFFQQLFIDTRKKKEKIENVELELLISEDKTVPIEINMSPIEKNGEFSGIVCTIRDITERKKVEEELKKSERLKTEFMNIAAHELKSPVTPIKGYLDLIISDKETSDQVKNWARVSLRNAERLLRLVNDILDVSRLDTDTMKFDMEKLNTNKILDEIVEDMKPTIERNGLKFVVEIPKELPNMMGDRYRLSQVLKNLFVNAIKFTDEGHIGIKVKKQEDSIDIDVEDTGIGISNNEIKKVFNKFYQAYTGDDRKNEGTGLGLFICKEIIKKHNGDIWVDSKVGKGSTFHIKLPYIHKMVVDIKDN